MPFKTENPCLKELHPWKPFIPQGATQLLLGTFPTAARNRGAVEFFYPNPNNKFWAILCKIAGEDKSVTDLEDPIGRRHQILKKLKLGLADMGYRVLRQRGNSSDGNIFPLEYTDIFTLLDQNRTVCRIIITSSSGPNSVFAWFSHYCLLKGVRLKCAKSKVMPWGFHFSFDGRTYEGLTIPSTSSVSRYKGEELVSFYRNSIPYK